MKTTAYRSILITTLSLLALAIFLAAITQHWREYQRRRENALREPVPESYRRLYRPDGTLMAIVPLRNGRKHGIEKRYDSKGRLRALIRYENGIREGWARYFFPDGSLQTMRHYRHGEPLYPLSRRESCPIFGQESDEKYQVFSV